jgi:hypothetical protein
MEGIIKESDNMIKKQMKILFAIPVLLPLSKKQNIMKLQHMELYLLLQKQ